jgi:hypothetical protein
VSGCTRSLNRVARDRVNDQVAGRQLIAKPSRERGENQG